MNRVIAALVVLAVVPTTNAGPEAANVAAAAQARFKQLDPFYKQHVVADGLLIVGSEKVLPQALGEVAYLARKMLANRPDLRKQITRPIAVMAHSEMQTDLPDCRGLGPWWDYRARGLAGSAISCGEENVLSFQGDPWQGESIFVHEFGHAIHGALQKMDKTFKTQLETLHARAAKSGRFRGYGIEGGAGEFWAEGVQAWFDCNGTIRPKSGGGQSSLEALDTHGKHLCHITTRQQVKAHLPGLARLLDESFRQNTWAYVPVAERLDQPHLRGFDPAEAPTFHWPPEVVQTFYAIEEAKKVRAKLPWAKVSAAQVKAAKALGVPVAFENSIGMRFVLIPPGTFMMGSRDSAAEVARLCRMPNAQPGWFLDEHPRHKVTVEKAFYLSIHEVTQGQYQAAMAANPAKGKKKPKKTPPKPDAEPPAKPKDPATPAVDVAWSDVEKFCKQLRGRDKREYALPTEAQWEYACRAGTTTPFAFGETISTGQANYHGHYVYGKGRKGANREKALPAGKLAANAWGLHDMHGNVSEWCADPYGEYHLTPPPAPAKPVRTSQRVVRGGSWRSYPGACRSAFRMGREPRDRSEALGFRLCCALPCKTPK